MIGTPRFVEYSKQTKTEQSSCDQRTIDAWLWKSAIARLTSSSDISKFYQASNHCF